MNKLLPTVVLPKGRLYEDLYELYKQKGIILPSPNTRQYYWENFYDECNIFIAKPKSIPQLLYCKLVEFGFCGYDLVGNTDYSDHLYSVYNTGLNRVKIVSASNKTMEELRRLNRPLIVATEYDIIASEYLTKLCMPYYIINTTGSTEGYVNIGADLIIDVVETGNTMADNGLNIIDTLIDTTTCLFSHMDLCDCKLPEIIQKIL